MNILHFVPDLVSKSLIMIPGFPSWQVCTKSIHYLQHFGVFFVAVSRYDVNHIHEITICIYSQRWWDLPSKVWGLELGHA